MRRPDRIKRLNAAACVFIERANTGRLRMAPPLTGIFRKLLTPLRCDVPSSQGDPTKAFVGRACTFRMQAISGSSNFKSLATESSTGSLMVLLVTPAGNADSADQLALVEQRKAATNGHQFWMFASGASIGSAM
jgi:hypothetical protein